jgi:hypothetical protein
MCRDMKSCFVKGLVRPDSRLPSTCCLEESGPKRLHEISEKIRIAEGSDGPSWRDNCYDYEQFGYIDLYWLEKLIFEHEEEEMQREPQEDFRTTFRLDKSDIDCGIIVILGEADILGLEMLKPLFITMSRVPRRSEIFKMRNISQINAKEKKWGWKFAARFSPRLFKPPLSSKIELRYS